MPLCRLAFSRDLFQYFPRYKQGEQGRVYLLRFYRLYNSAEVYAWNGYFASLHCYVNSSSSSPKPAFFWCVFFRFTLPSGFPSPFLLLFLLPAFARDGSISSAKRI